MVKPVVDEIDSLFQHFHIETFYSVPGLVVVHRDS